MEDVEIIIKSTSLRALETIQGLLPSIERLWPKPNNSLQRMAHNKWRMIGTISGSELTQVTDAKIESRAIKKLADSFHEKGIL